MNHTIEQQRHVSRAFVVFKTLSENGYPQQASLDNAASCETEAILHGIPLIG